MKIGRFYVTVLCDFDVLHVPLNGDGVTKKGGKVKLIV